MQFIYKIVCVLGIIHVLPWLPRICTIVNMGYLKADNIDATITPMINSTDAPM